MIDINERFKKAIDDLYSSSCNLATEVTKLGYPKLSTRVPTAGVSWDKKRKQICFEFNEKFAETLTDEEFSFVSAHESMHVAICHIFLIIDQVGKIKRKSGLSEKEKIIRTNKFISKSNIAADCVVNDGLVNIHKLKPQLENMAVYGKKTVGFDCHNLSMMQVYEMLPKAEEKSEDYVFDLHDWDSFTDGNGRIDKDFEKKIKGFIERNLNNSALSDEENRQLQNAAEIFQNTQSAGSAPLGQSRPITKVSRNYVNWSRLVLEIIEAKKQEDHWSRPARRLSFIYPEIVLPRFEPQEIETVFVAIDASGSIDRDQLSLFVDVVRNSPKKFKIDAVTFDTECYPLNIAEEDPHGDGGTEFQCIENYIQKTYKKYPKCVVVLTDGHGHSVRPQSSNVWCWLLTDNSTDVYCAGMKHHLLKDFLK